MTKVRASTSSLGIESNNIAQNERYSVVDDLGLTPLPLETLFGDQFT